MEKFVSSQPQYSLLYRVPEAEVIPLCAANGISQIVWSPLAQGVLTGKYAPGQAPPADSRATSDKMNWAMGRFLTDDVLEAVQRLRPIADGLGITMAQLALAWVLREPNVASAIVGVTRPEQLDDNVAAVGRRARRVDAGGDRRGARRSRRALSRYAASRIASIRRPTRGRAP